MTKRATTRPSIPAVCWLAVGAWAGAVAGEAASWDVYAGGGPGWRVWALPCACALAAAIGWWVGRARRGGLVATLCLLGVALGCACSAAHGAWWLSRVDAPVSGTVRGVVTSDAARGTYGPRVEIDVEGTGGGKATLFLPEDAQAPELGRVLAFDGEIAPPDEAEEWARRAARSGSVGSARVVRHDVLGWRPGPTGSLLRWRSDVLERLEALDGSGADLLVAVALGDRRRVSGSETESDFRDAGLSHLLAVSGLHLGLVGLATARLLRSARAPLWLQAAGCVGVCVAFACVTGMQTSTTRALVMVLVVWTARLTGRRPDGLAALGVAVVAMIASDPWSVFDLSLRLSVAAVGGLLLFGDLAATWVAAAVESLPRGIGRLLGATMVAQAATLPVVAPAFNVISIVAPLANLIAVPATTIALPVALVGVVLLSPAPGIGTVLLECSALLFGACARTAAACAGVPGAAVALSGDGSLVGAVLLLGAGAVWALWPVPGRAGTARGLTAGAVAVTLAWALLPMPRGGPALVMLDIGQGDALLVRDGASAMLVDCGADGRELRAGLARQGIRTLDTVVLTHDHDDHAGGLDGLTGVARVGFVGAPVVADETAWGEEKGVVERLTPKGRVEWRSLRTGDAWEIGRVRVGVLWPREADAALDTNDTSVVLEVSGPGVTAVLTGDAERASQDGLAAMGLLRDIDVLKIPHHGSDNGLTPEALEVWQPETALVSVGEDNGFGHPSEDVLEMLENAGARLLRTDLDGDVVVDLDDGAVRPERADERAEACARIVEARRSVDRTRLILTANAGARDGTIGARGPEARLPDPRRRGSSAAARGPPPA